MQNNQGQTQSHWLGTTQVGSWILTVQHGSQVGGLMQVVSHGSTQRLASQPQGGSGQE